MTKFAIIEVNMTNNHKNGFTVIELLFVAVIMGVASVVFFMQKQSVETIARDDSKKTAINAMYYALEEVFYPANKYYPQTIDSTNLKSIDPALFTDPDGVKLGDEYSSYTYSPLDCKDNQCKSYTLKATLSNEAEFTKSSKNN